MTEVIQQRGLAGKERRRREFRRARERYANHLIDDYFDAEAEVERAKRIPIRRCSAYLDSADRTAGGEPAHGVQMEFALGESPRAERPGEREVVWPPAPTQAAPTTKLIDESMLKLKKTVQPKSEPAVKDRAIRFDSKPTRPNVPATSLPFPQEWRPPMGYRSKKRGMSLGGFAYGCLIGGAAAACLLLIVHVVLG